MSLHIIIDFKVGILSSLNIFEDYLMGSDSFDLWTSFDNYDFILSFGYCF